MTAIDPPYRFNSRPASNRNRRILLTPAEVGYLNGQTIHGAAMKVGRGKTLAFPFATKITAQSGRHTEFLRSGAASSEVVCSAAGIRDAA